MPGEPEEPVAVAIQVSKMSIYIEVGGVGDILRIVFFIFILLLLSYILFIFSCVLDGSEPLYITSTFLHPIFSGHLSFDLKSR